MIDLQTKAIAALVALTMLSGLAYIVRHNGVVAGRAEVQAAWDTDKAERKVIADNQAASARETERKQNEISKKLAENYKFDVSLLANRLRDYGLQDAQIMSGSECVRVADGGRSAMPSQTDSAAGITATSTAGTLIKYSDALSDTLQCSKLIEWVKAESL
jgi:hypothetical protein